MKRRDLLAHIETRGCLFVREGSGHTWYCSPDGRRHAAIPRHREVVAFLVVKICRELDIPPPRGR